MAITFHACLSLSHLTVVQVLGDIGTERNLNRTPAMTRRPAFYIFDGPHHLAPLRPTPRVHTLFERTAFLNRVRSSYGRRRCAPNIIKIDDEKNSRRALLPFCIQSESSLLDESEDKRPGDDEAR